MITKKQVYLQFGFMRKETLDKLFEMVEDRPCCLSCQHYIAETGTQPDSLPFVKLELIESDSFKVGEDVLNTEIETHSSTSIIFKNLEGLAVLEKAIKHAKKQLKQQNKKL